MVQDPSFLAYQRANEFLNSDQPDKAIPHYLTSIKLSPQQPEPHHNLAIAYERTGQINQALQKYQDTLRLAPRMAVAHYNLGNLYLHQGLYPQAVSRYDTAIDCDPQFFQAYLNKGICHNKLLDYTKAAITFKRAIAIHNHPDAYNNLAMNLVLVGDLSSAVSYFREGCRLFPDHSSILSNYIRILLMSCDWSPLPQLNRHLDRLSHQELATGAKTGDSPFTCLIRSTDARLNYLIAQSHSRFLAAHSRRLRPPFKHSPRSSQKIHLGYLSYDFRDHVIAYHLMSVFKHHDRRRFQVYAYSYGPQDNSPYHKFIRSHADRFVDLSPLSFTKAAQKISRDQIDILVDLAGYTLNHRFEICALKPAPVQVNYLGFPGTTGADFMDYLITDPYLTPTSQRKFISEKCVYLPHTYQISSYPELEIPPTPSRDQAGLPPDVFVFASFNNAYKYDSRTFKVWLKLLKQVGSSILWLADTNALAKASLLDLVKQQGISHHRLIFAPKVSLPNHLSRLKLADICLDTPRYNGGSTTSNALYMGVPVITIAGTHYPSRMSTALLSALHLHQLITKDHAAYHKLAFELATHPDKLRALRSKIEDQAVSTQLFDSKTITRDLEQAYLVMWQRHQSGKPPIHLDLTT